MEELIARVTQATGLDAETAERAIGIILAFLKKEGPPDEVGRLLAAMPGSEDVVAQSGDGGPGGIVGGFMGMMGGGVMALGGQLFAFGREKAGEDVMGPIVGSIPGLTQFV